MTKFLFTFLLLFLLHFLFAYSIEVEVSNGRLRGRTVVVDYQQLHMFKRIPFAQAPLGQLRFRKPQPALNWTDVLDSTEYGPTCMIPVTSATAYAPMSENCLHINVFTSNMCLRKKNCPVFVMIHGGAFVFGNSVQYNDTQILNKFVKHEIVFVLPNYRLGFFGFADFGHDYDDAPYNVGLYDMIASLEWIQNEIHVFGGDPRQVTLMGYSSGASAIQYLLASPKLQDHKLFSQVFLDSGIPSLSAGRGRHNTEWFLELANCARDPDSNETFSIQSKLECLRSKPADELNVLTNITRDSMYHGGPQSNKDLMPYPNYLQMAVKRKSIPMIVITAVLEMSTLYEPEKTVRHICQENLGALNMYQNATIDACEQRYSEVYPAIRDFYHAIAALECRINGGDFKGMFGAGKEEVEALRVNHPCYLGIFAQANHSKHANGMIYLIGQHLKTYEGEFTLNDNLMDKFYPQIARNFLKGQKPSDNWSPADNHGKGYFYLDFEVTSPNRSEQKWPHFVANEWFDAESVEFYLDYLPTIEQNASQFNPKHEESEESYGFVPPRKFAGAAVKEKGSEEKTISKNDQTTHSSQQPTPHTNQQTPLDALTDQPTSHIDSLNDHERFYAFTSLWTLFLMALIVLVFGIVLKKRHERKVAARYTNKLLLPVFVDDKARVVHEYGAI